MCEGVPLGPRHLFIVPDALPGSVANPINIDSEGE